MAIFKKFIAAQILFALQAPLAAQAEPPALQAPRAFPVAGYWEGAIRLPGLDLAIEITLSQDKDGGLRGAISIPGQGLTDFGLSGFEYAPPEMAFGMPGIPGNPTFRGRIEGSAMAGDFSQGGASFAFELKRVGDSKPAPPLPKGLKEREITVGKGDWQLPGTLTLPAGKGPFPAAVIVHGSGPHTRNGPTDVYRDLAWALAEKGIAVLRYDKRTKIHGAKMSADCTLGEITVDDAVLAVEAAGLAKEISPKKIFVIGHSKGGYALGRIAEKSPKAAGFISLAGSARPLEDILPEQMEYLGLPEAELKKLIEAAARVKTQDLKPDTPASELPMGFWSASFWLDLRGYDPAASLRRSKRPALILQGEADYNVTMKDFEAWKKGFPEATFMSFPKLDHLFKPSMGKSTPAEMLSPGREIAPDAIKAIADWIAGQAKKGAGAG
jgi:fermentation-respiration switch protein FrsA (DUF1100 family)